MDFRDKDGNITLDPSDGYGIDLDYATELNKAWLSIVLRSGGELSPFHQTLELDEYDMRLPETSGAIDRDRLFAEAVCRFLNTGGNFERIQYLTDRMRASGMGTISFPEGWVLDTSVFDGSFEHRFVRPDCDKTLRWQEANFVEELPTEELDKLEEGFDDGDLDSCE